MPKSNERQSFETNYESIRRRNNQGCMKRINYKKVNKILLVIISIFIIFSIINIPIQKNEKKEMIQKYEQTELKLKDEIQQLKIDNNSLQTRLEDEENQFEFIFDKFLQTCFQDQKQTE